MSGFQRKTIRKILRGKMDALFATVENEELRNAMKRGSLITGGSITSMLLGEKINDYDIYFKTKELALEVAHYYVAKFNANRKDNDYISYTPEVKVETRTNIKGEEEERIIIFMKSAGVAGEEQKPYSYFENRSDNSSEAFVESLDDGLTEIGAEPSLSEIEDLIEVVRIPKKEYRPVFLTDNSINLTDKVQLIIRFFGSPEEIHRNFDFVHCTGVYDYQMNELFFTQEMLEAVLMKRLIYTGSLYPIASLMRIRKFIKRGWNISAGQILKIAHQLSNVNMNNPAVLKEQIMGVDIAYMHELITALQNREPGQRIDATYLANLVDKIFED